MASFRGREECKEFKEKKDIEIVGYKFNSIDQTPVKCDQVVGHLYASML